MKERGILFSAPMVRALLEGRKTQTRRLVTVPWKGSTRALPYEPYWVDTDGTLMFCDEYGDYHDYAKEYAGPYGDPGDRLWVRETHAQFAVGEGLDRTVPQCVAYRATCDSDGGFDYVNGREEVTRLKVTKWTPAIHMPRWASRITLEVTDVRVERLHEITEEDAEAEGVTAGFASDVVVGCKRELFAELWDSLNGARAPWASSPWVWRIAFRRLP